ncbi:hypothetical protein [Mangrovivirga cuniculi]|uniref:Polymer-forming cytoskeletal protein n=1 Tax=Mangrovivirga cuniculi TaxID=2715131 RepID=A0A4D7JYL8_9BACT|nr:hypothetical protein [Mangrovivirga cuniculi]QCK13764.1 hypothetical protein DCC35_02825 [Mangrovivirga cuniculi]
MKIKSSVLKISIIFFLLITILISFFISLTFLQKKIFINYKERSNLIRTNLNNITATESIDFGSGVNNSINVENNYLDYGLFKVHKTFSKGTNNQLESFALKGNINLDTTLYVPFYKSSITIENSYLEGDVFISKYGFSYIGKTSNINKSLVPKESGREIIWSVKFKTPVADSTSAMKSDSVFNSFSNKTLRLYQNGAIRGLYHGNIIIEGDHLILDQNSSLNDCILIANKVTVKSGFEGSVQINSDEVTLEGGSNLLFPSSIYQNVDAVNKLYINTGSYFSGVIVSNSSTGVIIVHDNARIEGKLHSNNKLLCSGTINGSVYSRHLGKLVGKDTVLNSIKNGVIKSLPQNHPLRLANNSEALLKWVK